MRTNLTIGASSILASCAFLFSNPSPMQMPAPLGRLHITSNPAGAIISINNVKRKEVTPVLLAVVPSAYTVTIGTCPNQPITVTVASGETKEVACSDAK
jgi:hypothetical protein